MSTSPFKGLNKLRDTTKTVERLKFVIDRATACRRDESRATRRAHRECRYCWHYGHGLAGQAFTPFACEACDVEKHHHNTAVPRFCDDCADEHGICVRCGADRELKTPAPGEEKKP